MLDNSWEELGTKKHQLALTKHSYIINITDQIHINYYIWIYLSTGLGRVLYFFWEQHSSKYLFYKESIVVNLMQVNDEEGEDVRC